jgi:hypothetical protein
MARPLTQDFGKGIPPTVGNKKILSYQLRDIGQMAGLLVLF